MGVYKKISLTVFALGIFFVSGFNKVKSQSTFFVDASELNAPLCSLPDTSTTLCTIYNYGPFGYFDSLAVYYNFGDGTDSTLWLNLT